ncbi:MAG: hypothetical protein AMS17_10455 [Spirochaetes bacterium DG_61]|jgi:hypothetical protein|nr:MAG: hypothetical protein AMS17_10455 [Spirochaetes bacterium DG_61]
MGARGYLILKLKDTADPEQLWELKTLYESIEGVEYASHVIGPYDFVVSVDLPYLNKKLSIESVMEEIRKTETCEKLISLKINNVFIKHQEIKDLKILDQLSQPVH